jgi:tRNA threonylcarbamoyladenosine biosynthesis protein TsaB
MQSEPHNDVRTLLIDTCGDGASVALSRGAAIVAQAGLARGGGAGGSSAEIVSAIGRMLQETGWKLRELDAVGVVSGPGSFTGVRVGMAAAKGLCEATGSKMIAVSRLVVLAQAASSTDGSVALDAGRGELYIGELTADGMWGERLGTVAEVSATSEGRAVCVAEAKVAEMLGVALDALRPIRMEDVLRTVLRQRGAGAEDMTLADANYVRRESDIYSRPAAGQS